MTQKNPVAVEPGLEDEDDEIAPPAVPGARRQARPQRRRQQAGRKLPCRLHHRMWKRRRPGSGARPACRLSDGLGSEAGEMPNHLEGLILRTESLEFEAEHLSGGCTRPGTGLPQQRATNARQIKSADSPPACSADVGASRAAIVGRWSSRPWFMGRSVSRASELSPYARLQTHSHQACQASNAAFQPSFGRFGEALLASSAASHSSGEAAFGSMRRRTQAACGASRRGTGRFATICA